MRHDEDCCCGHCEQALADIAEARAAGRREGLDECWWLVREIGNRAAADEDHGMAACADSIDRRIRALLAQPAPKPAECIYCDPNNPNPTCAADYDPSKPLTGPELAAKHGFKPHGNGP